MADARVIPWQLSKVLEIATDAVIVADRELKILYANPAVRPLLGYAPSELVGLPVYMLVPTRTREEHEHGVRRYQATGESHILGRVVELNARHRDGHDVPIELSLGSARDAGEETFVAILRDIRERKVMAAALEKANQDLLAQAETLREHQRELEDKNRLKTEFLARLSHELRTPLNAILGFSEAIIAGVYGPVPKEPLNRIHDIHASSSHLQLLVEDIIDMAAIEGGRLALDRVEHDVAFPIAEAVKIIQAAAALKNVDVTNSVAEGRYRAWIDPRRLRQVYLNLLSNAVRATPEGGRITVTAAKEKRELRVTVEDTGPGLKIDAPVDTALIRPRGGGTGLGLSIARSLVEAHGGSLTVDRPGEPGARFVVTLPL